MSRKRRITPIPKKPGRKPRQGLPGAIVTFKCPGNLLAELRARAAALGYSQADEIRIALYERFARMPRSQVFTDFNAARAAIAPQLNKP